MSSGWENDDADNVAYFTGLAGRYGSDVRAVNWGSAASQRRRFEVLAAVGLTDGSSVLDVGCGQADLAAWLKSTRMNVAYSGLDLTPLMVETSRLRFPEARFHTGSLIGESDLADARFDYVIASGIFYRRAHEPRLYLEQMVRRMFDRALHGAAFNSLSAWAAQKESGEFYADPLQTLEFCRSLTPWVTLRHDYHASDFTVYLHRERT